MRSLSLYRTAILILTATQSTRGQFIVPAGVVDESDTGVDRFDSSIQWTIGSQVTIKWESSFERITLKIWQGVWKGAYYPQYLLDNEPDPGNFTWTVAPVIDEAQTLNLHFQVVDYADESSFINSKDFQIYNDTDVVTQTVGATTQERTITKEVTVSPTSDVSESPTSTPADKNTQSTPGSKSTSTTSSAATSRETSSSGTGVIASETKTTTSQTGGSTNTSTGTSEPATEGSGSNNNTMKMALGVGLGLGIPLLAGLGFGLYWLGRRKSGAKTLPEMPPPPPMTFKPAWYDPGGTVGGIENGDNYAGGAMSQGGRR